MDADDSGIPSKRFKGVSGFTNINVIQIRYDWKIHNYSVNGKKTGQSILSPIFSDAHDSFYKWTLTLYPKGYDKEHADFLSLYLKLIDHKRFKPVEAKFTFCVVDDKNNEKHKRKTHHFFENKEEWGYNSFLKIEDLKNIDYADNSLIIRCDITAGVSIKNLPIQIGNCLPYQELEVKNKILSCQEMMFNNEELCDVTLITEDKVFRTHKTILAAQSPVFLALFKYDADEKQDSEFKLNVSSSTLQEFLRFLYCGRIENFDNLAKELFAIADLYAVEALKMECERFFINNINISNVIDFITLADRYNATKLKKSAIEFFTMHGKELIDKEEFNTMKSLRSDTFLEITKKFLQQ